MYDSHSTCEVLLSKKCINTTHAQLHNHLAAYIPPRYSCYIILVIGDFICVVPYFYVVFLNKK